MQCERSPRTFWPTLVYMCIWETKKMGICGAKKKTKTPVTLPSHHYRMEQLAVSSCFRDAFSLAEKLRSSLDHMTWQRCAETRQRHGATEQSTTWSTPPWLCAHFLSTSHPQLSLGEYVLTAVYRRIILFFCCCCLFLYFLVCRRRKDAFLFVIHGCWVMMRAASSEKQPLETVLENVLGISPSVFFSSPGQPCLSVLSYIDSVLLFLNCDFSGNEDNRFWRGFACVWFWENRLF